MQNNTKPTTKKHKTKTKTNKTHSQPTTKTLQTNQKEAKRREDARCNGHISGKNGRKSDTCEVARRSFKGFGFGVFFSSSGVVGLFCRVFGFFGLSEIGIGVTFVLF